MSVKHDKANANPHAGHREKLKRRFLRDGLDGFEDHNVLELILFFAIPRRDTNVIAHRLMERFGSFSKVFEAEIDELCEVDGIGPNAAFLIKSYPAVARRYYRDRFRPGAALPAYEQMGQDLVYHFAGKDVEEVYALFYDNAMCFSGAEVIHEGDINSVGFSVRKLCDAAVRCKAAYLVLAHNHPRGVPIPSTHDINTTKNLRDLLHQLNITLLDHFIVGENRYTSIQKKNYIFTHEGFLEELERIEGDYDGFGDELE